MATQYGTNATLSLNTVPPAKVPPGEGGGKVRILWDKFAMPSVTPPTNDLIYLFGVLLPPGARLMNFKFIFPAWSGSATADLGWNANETDAINLTGLWSALDVSSAGTKSLSVDASTAAGLYKKFNVGATVPMLGTQLVHKVHAAGSATTGTNYYECSYITE